MTLLFLRKITIRYLTEFFLEDFNFFLDISIFSVLI
jgi:hypothetical protein